MDPPAVRSAGRAGAVCKRMVARAFTGVRPRFEWLLRANGCRCTDHFAGFAITGRFTAGDIVALLRRLPEGSTELMVHPGYCTAELESAPTRLKASRAAELAALVAPEVRQALNEMGIQLSGYRALT